MLRSQWSGNDRAELVTDWAVLVAQALTSWTESVEMREHANLCGKAVKLVHFPGRRLKNVQYVHWLLQWWAVLGADEEEGSGHTTSNTSSSAWRVEAFRTHVGGGAAAQEVAMQSGCRPNHSQSVAPASRAQLALAVTWSHGPAQCRSPGGTQLFVL